MNERIGRGLSGGDEDARDTIRVLRQLAGPAFQCDAVMDFGCGVGRLTIPLARLAKRIVGVDTSENALAEARANCANAGLTNVELVSARQRLDSVSGPFDVVHSYQVIQHIAPAAGYEFVEAILDRVATRGGGMLHVTYAKPAGGVGRAAAAARRSAEAVQRLVSRTGEWASTSTFDYDLGRLFGILQGRRFDRVATRFTEQDGHSGIKLFFWRGY